MAEAMNGRVRLSLTIVAQVVAWIVAVVLAYGAVNARVSVLEDRYHRLEQDIREIKGDVKVLLQRP